MFSPAVCRQRSAMTQQFAVRAGARRCDSATVTKLPNKRLTTLRIIINFFIKVLYEMLRIAFSFKYLLPVK
jgi:hypothetical protein